MPRRSRRSATRWCASSAMAEPPSEDERTRFRYPELRLVWQPTGPTPVTRRAWAKFQAPGVYATTVTQPASSVRTCWSSCEPLVDEYGATHRRAPSDQEMPYPYVLEGGDELVQGEVSPAELARHFPTPMLSAVGDEVADGLWTSAHGEPLPLALFDAVRVDYSLRRLVHYTGTDWRTIQPWILLTNYQRYVDQFVRWASPNWPKPDEPVRPPGAARRRRGPARRRSGEAAAQKRQRRRGTASRCRPTICCRAGGAGGVTIVNIGVGPSNAKNITDHLAVLRPHCWLMVGHCGGLRADRRRSATMCWRTATCGATASWTTWCRPKCRCRRWPRCRWRCRRRRRRSPASAATR